MLFLDSRYGYHRVLTVSAGDSTGPSPDVDHGHILLRDGHRHGGGTIGLAVGAENRCHLAGLHVLVLQRDLQRLVAFVEEQDQAFWAALQHKHVRVLELVARGQTVVTLALVEQVLVGRQDSGRLADPIQHAAGAIH